jgi:hypothetical protein
MLPLYEEPHFTFRFAEARLIPRFRLEGVEAGRPVSVFKADARTGERLGLPATAAVGEGGWVDLPEPILVRAGEAFVAVPGRGDEPPLPPTFRGGRGEDVAIRLNEVIPWGRSFEEYRRLFALSDADLAGTILGCGDGPASFNAEASARGHAVVSCDPIYAFSPAEIERRVSDCYDDLVAQLRRDRDGFVWDDFRDPDHLGSCRLAAMRRFLADFEAGRAEGRYVTAALPGLPFEDGQFDLALVSHLLFLYSEQLDFGFHRAAVEELLRVAREVRIFPLLTLGRMPSPHVGPIRTHCTGRGWGTEIAAVPYEFQRGGNEMLRISRDEP